MIKEYMCKRSYKTHQARLYDGHHDPHCQVEPRTRTALVLRPPRGVPLPHAPEPEQMVILGRGVAVVSEGRHADVPGYFPSFFPI